MKFWLFVGLVALTYSTVVVTNDDTQPENEVNNEFVKITGLITQELADTFTDDEVKKFDQAHIDLCKGFEKKSSNVKTKLIPYDHNGLWECIGLVDKGFDMQWCLVPASMEDKVEQGQCEVCVARVGNHIKNGKVIPTCAGPEVEVDIAKHFCDTPDGVVGVRSKKTGQCVDKPELTAWYTGRIHDDDATKGDVSVGTIGIHSSSDNLDPEDLKIPCGPYDDIFADIDPTGFQTCNRDIGLLVNAGGRSKIYCYADQSKGELFSEDNPNGNCDCEPGYKLATDGKCHKFTCIQTTTEGPACKTCASPLTRNNECIECHDGYILLDGDCYDFNCHEDPDEGQWHGCAECKPDDSRRHPEDCLMCAHGYHFMQEQNHHLNQSYVEDQFFVGDSLNIQGKESGYCFPYNCVAGGNLVMADFMIAAGQGIRLSSDGGRDIMITKNIRTDHNDLINPMHPDVPRLTDDIYAFRDHCRTCVPQQKRLKDDHCETCNPGYYLDEMHHTCRKKTCGIPHFRRNAVSCTRDNLKPLAWSTPCLDCLDDGPDCCRLVQPVMTCGAQFVYCHLGTHKVGYHSIDCDADDCADLSPLCCEQKTCDNQQVACSKGQTRKTGLTECTLCIAAGVECCEDNADTCGLHNVKCGHEQSYLPADTKCTDCTNESLDCCLPMEKTCQNQNVFCHLGTHKPGQTKCGDECDHYGEKCCDPLTCLNQRVPCSPGRKHIPDHTCDAPGDCLMDSDNCCGPLPQIEDTCGNQGVKCEPRLYRPLDTPCNTGEVGNNCDNYGVTCCVPKTCANQGVGCSVLQAPEPGNTPCVACADHGNECCSDKKTCGLMGVQCKPGFYLSPGTECTECLHEGTECCADVVKSCMNQGTVCLPNTYRPMGTGCDDCSHYGDDCCKTPTCGNQNVACFPGSERLAPETECGDECYHGSSKCCADPVKTCANQSVKCRDGHYLADQNEILCDGECVNYGAKCCTVFQSTCGNQNVVCSADQTYAGASVHCSSCENHEAPCCLNKVKTCDNQNVVCRADHYADDYQGKPCGTSGCLNDVEPCCVPLTKTCANQSVVCSAGQTYLAPTTECGAECVNYGAKCCEDKPKTCLNQRVVCRPGHYADGYGVGDGITCDKCKNDVQPCCKLHKTTCGNMNTRCDPKTQKPRASTTECDGAECNHGSSVCCLDVTETCHNQGVVCRAGHYADGYGVDDGIACGAQGCLNDALPCCKPVEKTCGNQNVQCGPNQNPLNPANTCDTCTSADARCCVDITATCKNQGIVCRAGYYRQGSIDCDGECAHHGEKCCLDYKKTCGNQNVMCNCGQSYAAPDTECDGEGCKNGASPCCTTIQTTCANQQVMCAPGMYADNYLEQVCNGDECMHDSEPCCSPFKTTCGNMNVQCGRNRIARDSKTVCDGVQCKTDSETCCMDVETTCKNQGIVCRPGHYVDDYCDKKCLATDSEGNEVNMCMNDQPHCCKEYVKTCQNQNVRCGYGLTKKHIDGVDEALRCTDCLDYSTDCCEDVVKTCGTHGVACRQDLYKDAGTECTTCDVKQCCNAPPTTCASSKYKCSAGHYLPGDRVCETEKCSEEECCAKEEPTCANQNVQCHPEHHKANLGQIKCTADTPCVHYGSTCCKLQTCGTAGVRCSPQHYAQASGFENESCEGVTGACHLKDDMAPCCIPAGQQAAAPTCRNKYGVDSTDKQLFPFLQNFDSQVVSCDVSQGYYYRLDKDGNPLNTICSVDTLNDNKALCTTNDPKCCWRKTCVSRLDNNVNKSGFYNDASGLDQEDSTDVECPADTKLKPNAEYIVCHGDCISDCCVPDETCSSARVGCSLGYERVSNWDQQVCGNECVENSATCCKRTTCNQVACDLDKYTHKGSAVCVDCHENGPECCKPIVVEDTCSNQKVHCGYGFFKRSDYGDDDKTCSSCLDDGTECCVKKTCGRSDVGGSSVSCSGNFVDCDGKSDKPCWNCLDNGAECCVPKVPEKTCENQNVLCTFGYFHKAPGAGEAELGCKNCLTNGSDCCTQRTCGNPDGSGTQVGCGDDIQKAGTTPCTLCMANSNECCTKQPTCWSDGVMCPVARYHKHPNTVCGDNCDVEHCCAKKTCGNQGVCCNAVLGFSDKTDFDNLECTDCADNCETCCSFAPPTCGSAKVGCGYGMKPKPGCEDDECDTCALNDSVCCEPKTCGGGDPDFDSAGLCGADHDFLGSDVPCHFCHKGECCKPKKPTPTCRSENVRCGPGMKFDNANADTACDTCLENDDVCCNATTCEGFDCGDGFTCLSERSCILCEHHECCEKVKTCSGAGVGCGFGMRYRDDQSVPCVSCQQNDNACCEAKTCSNTSHTCPDGFEKINTDKSCSFCETKECCRPVIPEKTCSNVPVTCGHGFKTIEANADESCGTCEMNCPTCCARDVCTEATCNALDGFHRNPAVTECGICSVEECCLPDIPDKTCGNQGVGCGFGYKYKPNHTDLGCESCTLNDASCCDKTMCDPDGPQCSESTLEGLEFSPLAKNTECLACDARECCVAPVVPKTCSNQRVTCTGEYRCKADFLSPELTCETCLANDAACCEKKTCGNTGATCDRDLFTPKEDMDNTSCMVCASNALECCEPKLCGHHFFDSDQPKCNEETHTLLPRNKPCVNCNAAECCREIPVPTLKCAEIIIPNGQAFYSEPSGSGSARTKGSVLRVECDLGFKSQGADYLYSDDVVNKNQSPDVDHPVCDPILIEEIIEGHVEVYSPTTSGWNRAPPMCRPVSCPMLEVKSSLSPKHKGVLGKVVYRDAQMDQVPGRGSGFGQRDYAAEADVVCNEGWIRVPNKCVDETQSSDDDDVASGNSLDLKLKGYWRFESNTQDGSPHCVQSTGTGEDGLGTCNHGDVNDLDKNVVDGTYGEGVELTNGDNKSLVFDGTNHFVVSDDVNKNWDRKNPNELDIDGDQWTASVWVKLAEDQCEKDSYVFARYNEDFEEIVAIKLNNGRPEVIFNKNRSDPGSDDVLDPNKWINILVRSYQGSVELFVDGQLKGSEVFNEDIRDTSYGYIFLGADTECHEDCREKLNQIFHGEMDEVRYYTRAVTDKEIRCIAQRKSTCPTGKYYAKPYNTQGCNRVSEEIKDAAECEAAIKELLQDSVLGNSLNGGTRFNREIEDKQLQGAVDTPTKCSYRESDSQLIWNPNPTGRAHTSLAPICRRSPRADMANNDDFETVGCLPKCLENGEWSVALPTCEKDWCNPIHKEWGCCQNRGDMMDQEYWLSYHKQRKPKCPIGYGDCNHDEECTDENTGGAEGLCSQQRDLDNIDLCIVDMDPCIDEDGLAYALCCAQIAVGMEYTPTTSSHIASKLFFGGALAVFGVLAGYYFCARQKGEEHRYLLEDL